MKNLPPNAQWPEPWPVRPNAPENIGVLVRELGLNKDQYEDICRIAEDLVSQPFFREAVELVARAAMIAPSIDAAGLETLRQVSPFADPEPIGALTCSA